MKTYNIMANDFECPVIKAESPEEAMLVFATIFDSDLNNYFKASEVHQSDPLMRITNIEWDLSDIEDEAEAFSIMKNLPKSEDVNEFIDKENVPEYLSNLYGYCVKSFSLQDNSWGSAASFAGVSQYHDSNSDDNDDLHQELSFNKSNCEENEKTSFTMGDELWVKIPQNNLKSICFVIDFEPNQYLTILYPDQRRIHKYGPDEFSRFFKCKSGRTNDIIPLIF